MPSAANWAISISDGTGTNGFNSKGFTVQCAGGSEITQAAIVHLAHSVDPEHLLYIWDIADLVSFMTVSNPLTRAHGKLQAHDLPGLGVEPINAVLGGPVAIYD